MRIKPRHRANTAIRLMAIGGALSLLLMGGDERAVAAPGLACLLIAAVLWTHLWARDEKAPVFDVGMITVLATLAYAVIPLLNYWTGGLEFGPLSDARLAAYRIAPGELGAFYLRYVLYLFALAVSYAAFRRRSAIRTGGIRPPSRPARHAVAILFVAFSGYFLVVQGLVGVDFNMSYANDAYAEAVSAIEDLPLLMIQLSNKLGGILFVVKLALLWIVISKWKNPVWRLVLGAWIAVEIVQSVSQRGARTGLVLFLMAAVLFYHRTVKPLRMRALVPLGAAVLAGFLYFGVYRSYANVSEMRTDLVRYNTTVLATTNEFQSLLGTAFDVRQKKDRGLRVPWYVYLNDVSSVLPPQQVLPFEKVSASEWYLREIGLSGTGYGMMWGVVSQSVVGFDWFELALRGALLGWLLALFHRWYVRRQAGFLETVLYVFICVKSYYTFRDTTLSLLANLVWEMIPFVLLLRLSSAMLALRTAPARPARIVPRSSLAP